MIPENIKAGHYYIYANSCVHYVLDIKKHIASDGGYILCVLVCPTEVLTNSIQFMSAHVDIMFVAGHHALAYTYVR